MPSRLARRTFLLCLLVLALAPAAAQAAPVTTALTSPTDGSVFLDDVEAPPAPTVTYRGTSNIPATAIKVGCFRAGSLIGGSLATTTTDIAGDFQVTGPAPATGTLGWCQVRAVLSAATTAGVTQTGPSVFFGVSEISKNDDGKAYDYYVNVPVSRSVSVDFDALGGCGLDDSYNWDATSANTRLFYCNSWLYSRDAGDTRAGLILDGHNAVTPSAVHQISGTNPAQPVIPMALTFDPATKRTTITEADQLVRCNTDAVPVATPGNCDSYTPAGVTVDRTMSAFPLTGAGTDETTARVVITDTWKSTDGQAHTADLLLWEAYQANTPDPGFQLLAGSDPLAAWPTGASVNVPATAAPVSWLVQRRFGVPDSALDTWGTTAMYPAPSRIDFDPGSNTNALTHEAFTVPAGGSVVRRHVYTVAGTQAQALALKASAEDQAVAPALTAGAPASVFGPRATVSGTVTDPGGSDTLTVAGAATALGAGGAFSHEVALQPGANAVLVRATDGVGQSAEQTVNITRVLPKLTATAPRKTVKLTGTTTKSAKVTASLNGPGTITVKLTAKIRTTKTVRGHKRTTTKTITLGTGTLSVTAAGKRTITIKLTKTGAKLVKAAGRKGLKATARITGAFTPTDTTTKTITLTLRA